VFLPVDELALDLLGHFVEREMSGLDDGEPGRVQS
jgi:hypothetical protein